MELVFVFGLFAVVVGIGWWIVLNQKFPLDILTGTNEIQPYACVEINAGERACAAAQAHHHVRYLISEAPGLPLHDCTAARCTCKHIQFDDRRCQPRGASRGPGRSLMADAAYEARKQRMSHAMWAVGDRRAHWSPAGAPYATVGERRLRTDRLRSTGLMG